MTCLVVTSVLKNWQNPFSNSETSNWVWDPPTKRGMYQFACGETLFWICLRWLFTLYHGKLPLNHHLGDFVFTFPSIEESQIQVTSFFQSWPFDIPNEGHLTPEKVTNKTPKKVTRKNLAFQITWRKNVLDGQIARPGALASVEISWFSWPWRRRYLTSWHWRIPYLYPCFLYLNWCKNSFINTMYYP